MHTHAHILTLTNSHAHTHTHTYMHNIPVPALLCDAPVSSNGVITVTWPYIHTGGLPLTNLFLTYTHSILGNSIENFSNRSQLNMVSVNSVDSTSIVVPSLVTGAEYMFNITAENSYGSSSIVCGPTPHLIGKIECEAVIYILLLINDPISCSYQCHVGCF